MLAKFRLNDFAVGPWTIDLISWAFDSKSSFRLGNAFVASIVTLPSRPVTLPSASAISPPGTATSRTSAADASPPSRPSSCTSWPASRHRRASPPPTLPRPITVIFMAYPFGRCGSRVSAPPRARRLDADRTARKAVSAGPCPDPRQARVPQPGRLGQGPDRPRDDRAGGARGEAEARRDYRRADLGQHRRRPRHRGGRQGLPLRLRHARQDEPGEDLDAPRLWSRGRDHAHGRRPRPARVVLLRLVAARRGDPGRLQAGSVLE